MRLIKLRLTYFRLLLLAMAIVGCKPNVSEEGNRPNVLFIAVDDLRPQLGCYGDEIVQSPNIDKLAESGMVFNRAYCQMPICMASRASVLSGLGVNTGQYYFNGPIRKLTPEVTSINQHFMNNGYESVGIGKIYHHKIDVAQGWSKPFFNPKEGKWEENGYVGQWYGRGYMSEENKKMARLHDRTKKGRRGMGPAYEATDKADSLYIDGFIAEEAIKELNRLKDSTFFLAVGFIKPHLPFVAPKKYWDLYNEKEMPLANNPFYPEGAPEVALTDWDELRGYYGMPKEGAMPDALARKLVHGYYACISYTDALIGKVMDELERLELSDNTIVVLWSDHGWKLGDHGMWCKHTNYELDARSALIVSHPEMKQKGAHSNALVELMDIYPTLAELCDLDLPQHLEGKSMVPLLENPDLEWKKAAFTQYPSGGHSWGRHSKTPYPVEVMGYSIRTERYRYTEWISLEDNVLMANELYDYQKDPQGNMNIADFNEHEMLVSYLSKQLNKKYNRILPIVPNKE